MQNWLVRIGVLLFFMTSASCSLYESDQRKAIEKNENNIVGTYSGLTKDLSHYYTCARSTVAPDFLREPLEVIESPYEREGQSVLYNSHPGPMWIAVYHTDAPNTHDYCKVYPIRNAPLSRRDILRAARLGHRELKQLSQYTFKSGSESSRR